MNIPQCIHALPKIIVLICSELTVCRDMLQRLKFPSREIVLNIFHNIRFYHKETTIDPAFSDLRLLLKLDYSMIFNDHLAKTCGWAGGSHCNKLFLLLVKFDEMWNIHVANPIAVGHHEALFSDKLSHLFDSSTSIGLYTSIQKVDNPIFSIPIVCGDF